MSKHITSLNTLGLYLHLGWAEGYYNPLPLFLHCPQCNCFTPYQQYFQNFQKDVGILPALHPHAPK